jgi:hypothetical protein
MPASRSVSGMTIDEIECIEGGADRLLGPLLPETCATENASTALKQHFQVWSKKMSY